MTRIHFLLTCLYVSSLTLLSSGQAAAHQWDTPVPHLSERMQLVKTGNCPNCTLSDADLSYKELAGTTLTGADLRQANFMRTGLKDAILIGADLRSANLPGPIFMAQTLRMQIFTGLRFQDPGICRRPFSVER